MLTILGPSEKEKKVDITEYKYVPLMKNKLSYQSVPGGIISPVVP
jgi:hypothetical protein